MNGILGEVGKVLVNLQDNGEATVKKTEELYLDEIIFYVEEMLKGVKAEYRIDIIEKDVMLRIKLQ